MFGNVKILAVVLLLMSSGAVTSNTCPPPSDWPCLEEYGC